MKITQAFLKNKKVATLGVIVAAVVLTSGVGIASKSYLDNQAKVKANKIAMEQKAQQEKTESELKAKAEAEAKAKAEADALAAAKAAEEAAKSQVAAPAPAPVKKTTTTKAESTETVTKEKISFTINSAIYGANNVAVSLGIGTNIAGKCTVYVKKFNSDGSYVKYGYTTVDCVGPSTVVNVGTTSALAPGSYKVYADFYAKISETHYQRGWAEYNLSI